MKILSIGSDRGLFDERSAVRQRIIEYGSLVEELHIVVLVRSSELKTQNFGNVFLYPTNSRSRWLYVFDAARMGKKIMSAPGQWLITTQDPFESGLAGWLIGKKFNAPLQLQVHADFLSPHFRAESFLNRIRVLLAKFLIPRADCIRAVSERIKNSLARFTRYSLPITILPIFVDVKKIQETEIKISLREKYPQFNFIILMASRLTKEKNIGLAIEAMAEIVKKRPKTGLIIAGEGPELQNLKSPACARPACRTGRASAGRQISKLKIDNIKIEDWTDDLISYYKTADLFLLTSNYEGFGRTAVEAMAAGCPVIMTDVGLAGEFLINGESGLIVPVGDKEKLSEAILRLMENPELRADIAGKAGKKIASRPAKEEYLKAYLACWLSCKKQRNF